MSRPNFSATDKRKAAQRELAMRERVYPGWVDARRMTKEQALREIALMREIASDYAELERQERGQEELPI